MANPFMASMWSWMTKEGRRRWIVGALEFNDFEAGAGSSFPLEAELPLLVSKSELQGSRPWCEAGAGVVGWLRSRGVTISFSTLPSFAGGAARGAAAAAPSLPSVPDGLYPGGMFSLLPYFPSNPFKNEANSTREGSTGRANVLEGPQRGNSPWNCSVVPSASRKRPFLVAGTHLCRSPLPTLRQLPRSVCLNDLGKAERLLVVASSLFLFLAVRRPP
jgi:hypothetical protein